MKVIGVTGRIGSGKTTFCRILAHRAGCLVIDADRIGHEALKVETVRRAILERFGIGIIDDAGAIDRGRLGSIVFADESALRDLNGIVHPWIIREIQRRLADLRRSGRVAIVLLDAPLLLDYADQLRCDHIVLVRTEEETAIERLRRRGCTDAEARRRLSLKPASLDRVDAVVENSGPPEQLEQEAGRLWGVWMHEEERESP